MKSIPVILVFMTTFLLSLPSWALTVNCIGAMEEEDGSVLHSLLTSSRIGGGAEVLVLRGDSASRAAGVDESMIFSIESSRKTRTGKIRVEGQVVSPAENQFVRYTLVLPQRNLLPGTGIMTLINSETGEAFGREWELDCRK